MTHARIIVAIDIGSSSARCSAYELLDPVSNPTVKSPVKALDKCRTSRSVRSIQPNTGKIELLGRSQDGSDDQQNTINNKSLMDNVDECMDELLNKLRHNNNHENGEGGFQVVAVGFSCFVMNLVGVDCDGNIVGDGASISYACNSPKVAEQCRDLRSRLGEDTMQQMYQNTGAPIHSAYALPQLLVMYDNDNKSYEHTRTSVHKWQTIASICLSRWTGAKFLPISFSEASWTGLLNFRTCEYESSLIDLLPESCRRALPDLADFSDTQCPELQHGISRQNSSNGKVDNPYWDRWPELRGHTDDSDGAGCRLFLGLGDGACANIGSKCSTASRIAVTIGTSAAARVCLPLPVGNSSTINVPRGLFCYRINREHILVGGALTDGGCVVEWVSSLLNLSSTEALNECMSKVECLVQDDYTAASSLTTDAAGCQPSQGQQLTIVPFLSGERSTGYRDGATGAILGLTRETTPAHMLKGCLEGVTLRIQAVLQLVQQAMRELSGDGSSPCIIASGKALEVNPLWRQLLSDSSDLEVIMDNETEEGTSRGVALTVAVALNAMNDDTKDIHFTDEPLVVSTRSSPNSVGTSYWKQASESQESFLGCISPLYH